MREILFCGKRIDNGEWVEGSLAASNGVINIGRAYILPSFTNLYSDRFSEARIGNFIEVYPNTVGQYTGLCDKNGKKIFEGDIVRALEEGEVIGYCEIKFGEYSVGHVGFYADWYAGRMAKYFRNDLGHWTTHKTIEVIGNRADNKELLEVDNG